MIEAMLIVCYVILLMLQAAVAVLTRHHWLLWMLPVAVNVTLLVRSVL